MIRTTLIAAAAILATGMIAAPADADAGFTITIGSSGHGYGAGSGGYYGGPRGYGHGYRPGRHYGGWNWYGRGHGYRPHCRWKVKRMKVRYWNAYTYRWATRIDHRRYRVCR